MQTTLEKLTAQELQISTGCTLARAEEWLKLTCSQHHRVQIS